MEKTLPRSPRELEALIRRYTRLKQAVTSYIQEEFAEELFKRVSRLATKDGPDGQKIVTEEELYLATDGMLYETSPGMPPVLECFVQDHPELSAEDRERVLGWMEGFFGLFQVREAQRPFLKAFNLMDDLDYLLLMTKNNPELQRQFTPGTFFTSYIAPLYDAWTLSGAQMFLPFEDERLAYGLAADLVMQKPKVYFRNPKHLKQALEAQQEDFERFCQHFGKPWVTGTPAEIEEAQRSWHEARLEGRGEGEFKPSLALRQQSERAREEFSLPEDWRSFQSIGMVYHPQEGLFFLPYLGDFEEALAHPAKAGQGPLYGVARDYLQHPEVSPSVLELFGREEPEKLSELYRVVLNRPDFDWERDGEALLRRYKPGYGEEPLLPSTLPLNQKLVDGLLFYREFQQKDKLFSPMAQKRKGASTGSAPSKKSPKKKPPKKKNPPKKKKKKKKR